MRGDPNDPDGVVCGGVDLQMSTDGGKTVNTAAASKIHSDHHAIWFDPANSNHILIGNDGGLAVTWDQAKTWNFFHNLPIVLFYHVSVDMDSPYHVYGGLQDNSSWVGDSAYPGGITNSRWENVYGGGGFLVFFGTAGSGCIFFEYQWGQISLANRQTR